MSEDTHRQDEEWWERELHRNQKLMDRYMEVFESDPDWNKWKNPQDLYNKVHFGIDPPERAEDHPRSFDWNQDAEFVESDLDPVFDDEPEDSRETLEESDEPRGFFDSLARPDDAGYDQIRDLARSFGVASLKLKDLPPEMEVLRISGAKIGANLAGGHGLGYHPETICGNIVKCRWALADCEFCREILEYLYEKSARSDLGDLAVQCRQLGDFIRIRIEKLRSRSPWSNGS